MQTRDLKLTLGLSAILVSCIILFAILYRVRLKVRRNYRENHRKLRKESEVLINDVKNIEPLIKEEFTYRVNLVIGNQKTKRSLEKKEILKLNALHVCRTIVLSTFMVSIIIFKLLHAGGIDNLSIIVLTDIIAISTVYSNILDKVASILDNFETIQNTLEDAERVKTDVDNIMEVYSFEKNAKFVEQANISKITVKPFEFSYSGSRTLYTLRNINSFVLEHGKSYLVYGHTGCGKSTFMHLLIGKIRMSQAPISYDGTEDAYLASIMHESNGRLGANPVLQELIFDGDIDIFNKSRMIDILHGTHIYEDVMRNLGLTHHDDEKVLEYLNTTTIEQYSSGQKQRLAIVKVLYNLNNTHQIVVFDEATNALDDKTALSVLKYMTDFCQKDKERIVLFVSHQVNLTKNITNGSITFASETFPIFDIKTKF
jgi:ABC-type bacteriocin/lantibiotic exporter with double-glycine peptidase domain